MLRFIVLVLSTLILVGCVTNTRWVRPGATAAEFDQEKLRCQYEAELATANRPTGYGLAGAISSGVATGMQQNNLMTLCMKTKGWTQEAAPAAPAGDGAPINSNDAAARPAYPS